MFGLLAGDNTDLLCQTADGPLLVRIAPASQKLAKTALEVLEGVRNQKVTLAPPSKPIQLGALESTIFPGVLKKLALPYRSVPQSSLNEIELRPEDVAMVSGPELSNISAASLNVNKGLPATFQDLSLSSNTNGKQTCPPLSSSPRSSCSKKPDHQSPNLGDTIVLPTCTGSYSAKDPGLSLLSQALQKPESISRVTMPDLNKKSILDADLPSISTREPMSRKPAKSRAAKKSALGGVETDVSEFIIHIVWRPHGQ